MNSDEQHIDVIPGKLRLSSSGELLRLELPSGPIDLSVAEGRAVATAIAEASAALDGMNPDEHDWKRIPMQYLHFLIEADTSTKRKDRQKGISGSVHCWIKEQTKTNAFHIAVGWVTDDDWIVTELTDHRAVTRKDYEGTDYLEYYEQTLLDEEVFLTEIDGEEEG